MVYFLFPRPINTKIGTIKDERILITNHLLYQLFYLINQESVLDYAVPFLCTYDGRSKMKGKYFLVIINLQENINVELAKELVQTFMF
jgi:hypothetical protein